MTTENFSDQKEYLELSSEEAKGIAFLGESDLFEVVLNEVTGDWRWGTEHDLVIKDLVGNYWRTFYRRSSGDGDWHTFADGLPIVFTRVVPREKVEIEYVDAE